MMDTREQIEFFALGKLSGPDLSAFEARMNSDKAFADFVAEEVELIHAIRLSPAVDALRDQLKTLETERSEASRKSVKGNSLFQFLVAASILLAAAAVWFFNQTPANNAQELFAAHFQPPSRIENSERGFDKYERDSLPLFFRIWEHAERDYNNGDFTAAIDKLIQLQNMPESISFSDDLAFLQGLSCLQSEKALEAIEALEKIKETYPSEKPWYLALAYLKSGQVDAARTRLKQIAIENSPFSAEASAILQSLK